MNILALLLSFTIAAGALAYLRLAWRGFVTVDLADQARVYIGWLQRCSILSAIAGVLAMGAGVGGVPLAALALMGAAFGILLLLPPALTMHHLAVVARDDGQSRRRRSTSSGKRIRRRPARRWVRRGLPQEQPDEDSLPVELSRSSIAS